MTWTKHILFILIYQKLKSLKAQKFKSLKLQKLNSSKALKAQNISDDCCLHRKFHNLGKTVDLFTEFYCNTLVI